MLSLKQFIARQGLRFSADWADSNPNAVDFPAGSSHWRCVLRHGRRQLTVPFSQGPAICHEPELEDVLDCLASDAATYENARSFEEWCADLGFNDDSRKAERVYRTVEKQAAGLRRLLGDDTYETLLWETERA